MKRFGDGRDVFFERRFGLYIHWGLYAIPAWHEQLLWRTKMTRAEYEPLMHQFDPVRYDPDTWVSLAKDSGMQYINFTAKHHDGFCMFDTAYTDYKVTNSPYGRDTLEMLANACARQNLPLSIYYSLPDWHHPDCPNEGKHHQMFAPRPGDTQIRERYYEYVRNQIRELMANYGPIYQFFWDINVDNFEDPALNDEIRRMQPNILINDRGPGPGDYCTPERHFEDINEFPCPTEAVSSFGRESWGYKKDEDYYTDKYLMQCLDNVLVRGGNYLLNIGPKPDGTLPEQAVRSLGRIADWYARVKEAFVDTAPASYLLRRDEFRMISFNTTVRRERPLATKRGRTVYVHLPEDCSGTGVLLIPMDTLPERAVLLNNGQEVETMVSVTPWHYREKPYLRLRNLPVNTITDEPLVIRLDFGEDIVR